MLCLRRFRDDDLDECTELFLKVFSSEPWNDKWESQDHVKIYLKEFINNPIFYGYVAQEDSTIIGACFSHSRTWWEGRELYIDEMFVNNERQGEGIGSRLIEYIKGDLKTEGFRAIVLLTDKDLPAEKFYVKNGFRRSDSNILMISKL